MSDTFFAFVKTTWEKTNGEKAIFWRAYGWIVLVSFFAVLSIVCIPAYLHFFSAANTSTVTVILISVFALVAIIVGFYWMLLMTALPYFVLRFLRKEEGGDSFSIAVRKALVHKWAIFFNWILFGLVFNTIRLLLHHFMACDICILPDTFLLSVMSLLLSVAGLEILENHQAGVVAFVNAWKLFWENPIFFIETTLWIFVLSLFGFVTLFIGSIWGLPAQTNAVALLYEKIKE